MSFSIQRLDSPSSEAIKSILDSLRERNEVYSTVDGQSGQAWAHLPEQLRVLVAADSQGPIGLLFLCHGVFDPWGAPTDFLGANPILPNAENAAKIHSALLAEATMWATEACVGGLEILLPMGPQNMQRDSALDDFYKALGFERFYYTMTRDITALNTSDDDEVSIRLVPVSTISMDALYRHFAASLANGEIEYMSNMSDESRREYFESLTEETMSHPGSLALMGDSGLLGFTLVAGMSGTAAHLAWIGILPEHRNRGLGRALLCRAMNACREEGVSTFSLYTDSTVGAQTLYSQLDFSPAGALAYRWQPKHHYANELEYDHRMGD